jgi:hypothetical protein
MSHIIPYRVGQLRQLRVQLGHEPTEIFLLSTGAAEVAAARMVLVREVEACGFDATLSERAHRAGRVHSHYAQPRHAVRGRRRWRALPIGRHDNRTVAKAARYPEVVEPAV